MGSGDPKRLVRRVDVMEMQADNASGVAANDALAARGFDQEALDLLVPPSATQRLQYQRLPRSTALEL